MRKDNKKIVYYLQYTIKNIEKNIFIFFYKNLYLNPKNIWNPYDG